MSDPRRNKHSASGIEGIYLCPGKANAERGLPELDDDSEDSKSGTRIHNALAGKSDGSDLSSAETTVFEHMQEQSRKLAERGGFDPLRYVPETRLWFNEEFSGEPDRVYLNGPRAQVHDYKSGFLPVTTAPENPQLATLGILTIYNYGVAEVEVAIIPRFGPVKETATYNIESASAALSFIRQIIAASEKPDAPRRPGHKQCRYCAAKTRCEEFKAWALLPAAVPVANLPALPADRLAEAIDRIPAINSLIDAIKAEGKRRVKDGDPEFSKLYTLTEGREVRTIVNLPTLFAKCRELGITDAEFTAACSIPIGEVKGEKASGLAGLVHKACDKIKGTALDKKVNELLSGCVATSTTQGSLKRKDS